MTLRQAWGLVKQTFVEWWEDSVSRLAASLAFYTAFAIAPLLVIAVRVAGIVFEQKAARSEVSAQLRGVVGAEAAAAIEAMLEQVSAAGSGGTVATVLGLLFFVYASTSLFAELQDAMNTIWEVKPKPDRGWGHAIRRRLLPFAMVLGTGFLLMVSLVLSAALAAASRYVGGSGGLGQVLNLAASLALFTLLFAAIYKVLPDVDIGWSDVWVGAAATAALFALGKFLIGLYLARPSVSSVYGAAGSLAILLLWVYYSAHVLFLGAEFTQVFARRHGRRIRPDSDAVEVTELERARQGIPHDLAAKTAEGPARLTPPPPLRGGRVSVSVVALLIGFALGRLARRQRRAS